jgi:hypothetical protein
MAKRKQAKMGMTVPKRPSLTESAVSVRKRVNKSGLSVKRRPAIQWLKIHNVYLRPFDADRARETFVRLCRKHIMVNTLDSVDRTAHLANEHTTLFLVGEIHTVHTKCKEILEMFEELVAENSASPQPLIIDFMVELLQHDVIKKAMTVDWGQVQIENVRAHFVRCIQTRDCSVRVHWADPTLVYHERNIPLWLNDMGRLEPEHAWSARIGRHLEDDEDLTKLLTENRLVVKEIGKASRVNPAFTMEFATRLFEEMWDFIDAVVVGGWRYKVWFLARTVVDFYTAARIVKMNMKHAIYYAGAGHTENIIKILTALDFRVIENDKKSGHCAPVE